MTAAAAVATDLLIVGAGPVGLYGAFYAGLRGLRSAVIDSLSECGGQVSALYPEKRIFDVAGLPAVRGRDLVAALVSQAAEYAPEYLLQQQAQTFKRQGDTIVVTTDSGREIRCRAVIVTGGIGTFTPRPLPVGTRHLGVGLSYFVVDPLVHTGRDILVVGGGDSALDWALMLEPIAASVTLVHRRQAFRAHPSSVTALRSSSVRVITDAEVTEIHGSATVEAVTIRSLDGEELLDVTAVVAALGFTANLGPLRQWGAELHDNRHLVVDTAMRTCVPGLYAAGDITDYDGKVRLISVGFGEVATAVNNAAVYIDADAVLFPGHSSDLDVPATTEPA